MKHNFLTILFLFFIGCIILTSCQNQGENDTATKEKEIVKPAVQDNDIELTEDQMKAVGVETGVIVQKNLHSVVKANGQLTVPPQNQANVSVFIGGVVTNIAVLEGNYVKKGQQVATIENPEFVKLQQDYLMTRNDFSYTQSEYRRQKELQEQNAGTGKVFQQAEATYNAQKAKLSSLEKQLRQINVNLNELQKGNIISAIPILAPIDGTIGHINISVGTFVDPTKSLMDITDNSHINCNLFVFERDVFKVKARQKVNLTLNNQNNRQITGEIYGVNKSFENDSKTIIAHATIRSIGKDKLIPGIYVTALINVGNQLTSAVPIDAVVRAEDKDYIYIVVNKQVNSSKNTKMAEKEEIVSFKKMEVAAGVSELGYIEITPLEEIPAATRIVTKGAFYILSKAKSGNTEDLN